MFAPGTSFDQGMEPVDRDDLGSLGEDEQDGGLEYDEEEAAAELEDDSKSRLLELYRDLKDEMMELKEENQDLQKRLAAHFMSKKTDEPIEESERSSSDEQRYFQSLKHIGELKIELVKVQEHYDQLCVDLKGRLEVKQGKVSELRTEFQDYKMFIAAGAESSASGQVIPPKVVKQLEAQNEATDVEVAKVRLKNIHLRNQFRKLETSLRKKEELSSELHLIDFEQLKIENQALNEKIEERNEELLKLRKKTTTTVQVLTHLKEKLQFVQAENQILKSQLSDLENELTEHRDLLTKAKQERDRLRYANLKLKENSGLLGSDDLLRDFHRRKGEIERLADYQEDLKSHYRDLSSRTAMYQSQLKQASLAEGQVPQR